MQVLDRDRHLGHRGGRGADHAGDELGEQRAQPLAPGQRIPRHVAERRVEAEVIDEQGGIPCLERDPVSCEVELG